MRDSSYFQRPLFHFVRGQHYVARERWFGDTREGEGGAGGRVGSLTVPGAVPPLPLYGDPAAGTCKGVTLGWEEFSGAATGVSFCCSSAGRFSP